MPMYRWRARITLKDGRTSQEVVVEAASMPQARDLILSIYSGCRITWGPVQL